MALILVVDDKEETCESLKASLESRDHAVHTTQSVQGGINALRRSVNRDDWTFTESYAVAIIDLNFERGYEGPDSETAGMHVVKEALKVPFLEPIVLTAFPSVGTAAESVEKGVFRYVTKAESSADQNPFMNALATTVDLALENREVMRTLDESLRELRRSFGEMEQEGILGSTFDAAKTYLDFAEKANEIILRARGRHPAP